jgi:hypothetical protein
MRRRSLAPLLVSGLALLVPAKSVGGPSVKKSRWRTWSVVRTTEAQAFGFMAESVFYSELRTPGCNAGEMPLLMRVRATPTRVTPSPGQTASLEDLGRWSLSVYGNTAWNSPEPATLLFASASGGGTADAGTEAGIPWNWGRLSFVAKRTDGLRPAVESTTLNLEFTGTCGRVDTPLAPMRIP